jgi:photosystem II stability/assembly factor-like uncharacterized protein
MSNAWGRLALGGLPALVWLAATGSAAGPTPQDAPVVTSLTLFAGTREGPFLSRDWGASWEPIERVARGGDDPRAAGATHAFYPVGPRVYMGGEGGLFVSEDFGETWSRREPDIHVLAILPSRYALADPTVFVGTPQGLLKSASFGHRFEPTPLEGTPIHRIEWPGPALVVATGKGVFVSMDGGATFEGPGEGLPSGNVPALALSSFYPVDPVLFASVASEGVFRSSDGAKTWTAAGLEGHSVSDLYWLGPSLFAVAEQGLFRSQDLGHTWSDLTQGLREMVPTRVMFPLAPESGATIFLAARNGVYRSEDGGNNWRPSGLADRQVLCLATFPPPNRSEGLPKR